MPGQRVKCFVHCVCYEKQSSAAALYRRLAPFLMVQFFLLVSLFFSAFLPNTYAKDLKEKKRVLVIFHAQSDLPAYPMVEQGIKQGLGAGTEFDIEYFIEYLDSDRNPDQKHNQLLSDLYHHKFSKKKIDLIITYGLLSLEFVIAHTDDVFQNIPVVFSAIPQTNIESLSLTPEITGVLADIDYVGLLNTALEIHPETRHVAVVNGASHTDLAFEEGFRQAFEPYTKQFDFIYLTRLPFADIEEKVKNLPEQSVILFYLLTQDGNGKGFVPRQAVSILAKEANAPVYGILDSYFGDGIVGGKMFSVEMVGLRAGEMALRILRGEKPSNIPMSSEGTTINKFDWRQFKRFGIREDRLPPGSIVQFKTYSFWDSYRWYIVGTFFVLFVQSGLVLYLMMVRIQRRRAMSQLAKRLRFEEMLSALSARFVNLPPEQVDPEIRGVLESIGKVFDLDRVSVFEVSENDQKLHLVDSYKNSDIKVQLSEIQLEQFPWARQKILNGETLIFSDPEDLPAEAGAEKNLIRAQGIISVAAIPLSTGKKTLGLMSLTMLRHRKEWPNELIRQCRLVAEVFANALVRKQHEESLMQAEKKYRTVADFTYDWEFWVKVDHTMEYVSPSCERVSGYTVQEFKDDPSLFKAIIVPEDRYLIDCHYRDSQRAIKPSTIQFRILRRDGQIRWIEHSCQPVTDDEGNMVGFRASNRDVTSRKLAEIDLRNAYTEISELKAHLEAETAYLQDEIKIELNFGSIIGNSDALKYALFKVEQVAMSDSAVLITGETGTGKELIARAVHNASRYKNRPLVKVDCAALPANLIESELFGYEKGAFSGADAQRIGRFELADGTSLFLDEIGELPLELQSKLLRVLQDGEFERLGSNKTIRVKVRIIAATNRPIEAEVRAGRFREDLWYRLNVFPITVPPLRDRVDDILPLAKFFMEKISRRMGKSLKDIPMSVIKSLQAYPWPGNVRELEHVIERGVINSSGTKLRLMDDLSAPVNKDRPKNFKTLVDNERDHITSILAETQWRVDGPKGAALILDMHPSTLRSRISKLGIKKP